MSEWIGIEDDMPKIGLEVLVWSWETGRSVAKRDCDFQNSFIGEDNCFIFGVTHWMPLPEPPK